MQCSQIADFKFIGSSLELLAAVCKGCLQEGFYLINCKGFFFALEVLGLEFAYYHSLLYFLESLPPYPDSPSRRGAEAAREKKSSAARRQ